MRKSYGHLSLVNSRALELAGYSADTPDPPGGEIKRDPQGNPTGVLIDSAQRLGQLDARPTPEQNIRFARRVTAALIAQGATSFIDAGGSESSVRAMKALSDAGELPLRANFAIRISGRTEARNPEAVLARIRNIRDSSSEPVLSPAPGLHIGTVKLNPDGDFTYPSHSAAMLEPYRVNVGTQENPTWKPGPSRGPDPLYFPADDVLNPLVAALDKDGWQIHVHSNGDRATRRTLDAFEAAQRTNRTGTPPHTRRHTITHLFLVDPADWPRFGEIGVIASMAFQWHKRDNYNIHRVENYMGPDRFARIYPARGLLNGGALLAYGSDAPVDALDYWFAMEVAVTRTGEEGGEYAGPLNAAEYAITLEQAIDAFTINSAYQLNQEHVTGSLEVGKFADLILLDRNLFEIPITEISETKVLMTMVGGKIVYSSEP
jgi:predicted amidohydrolase YtcJ